MRFLLALLLLIPFWANATTFTEFYVQTTGSNLNSGHTPDDSATFTATSGFWTNSTATFAKAALNPVSGGVTNGAWASVYANAGTVAAFIGIVTNCDDTTDTITLSQVAKMGTNPADDTAGGMSIKVGGAWKGPNAGVGFPFNFLATTATNSPGQFPRCNIKSNALYSVTSGITHTLAGPMRFQGYTTTPGDFGRCNIDGGTTALVLLNATGANCDFVDIIFSNNGTSGANSLVTAGGNYQLWLRCVAHDSRLHGFNLAASVCVSECEAYNCNKSNGDPGAGFFWNTGRAAIERCVSHDNTTTKGVGFYCSADGGTMINCIADGNGWNGLTAAAATTLRIVNSDFYNNNTNGIWLAAASQSVLIKNCNFVKNGVYGIYQSGSTIMSGEIINCGFGSGTQTNGSGGILAGLGGINEYGSVLYPSDTTPWTDPANGNFSIAASVAARAAGRGVFTQTQSGYSGAVGYPDIGSAQAASTNSAASPAGGSYTFAQ